MTITEFGHPEHGWKWTKIEVDWINARIAAEIAATRERCAQTVKKLDKEKWFPSQRDFADACVDAIRKVELWTGY